MKVIGQIISNVLKNINNQTLSEKGRQEVQELTERFPLYPNLENN
jgi:glycine hydroxymethyltransferase